jgi:calcium-translocating P-type ATPase
MKIHRVSVEEALASLHTGAGGLSAAEAERRLREFGPNRVERARGTPLPFRFVKGLTHFFALILWLAAGLAFLADWLDPEAGMGPLGVAILGVILVNALFSFWQEYKAERALAALEQLLPRQAKVLRDGKIRQAPAEALVPGDVILLDDGDEIPADCRLIEGFGVRVNTATVTGESAPRSRDERPSVEYELLHSRNTLLAGTSVVSGRAKAVVFATGMSTEFGQIARLSQDSRAPLSPLQQEIVRLSRLVATLSVVLGGTFFVVGQGLGLPFWHNLLFAIGVIVANVPEGLLPTVTLALAMGSQRMARKNALIRHLPSVEALGAATVICTDKTGTLTQNCMAAKRLFVPGRLCDLPDGEGLGQLCRACAELFEAALLCHTLKEVEAGGSRTVLGDPMEVALAEMARRVLPQGVPAPRVDEVPFDSDRRRLSTLHQTPGGLVLYTKGALESLLPLCREARTSTGDQPLSAAVKEEFLRAQDRMGEDGLRVLAFAYRKVPEGYDSARLEEDLTLLGLVGLEDPPRPEVPAAIRTCRAAGIRVIMVTGDHPETARAIARQIGLVQADAPPVLTGDRLRHLSPAQLQLALDTEEVLFARVAADQKRRIVEALRAKGHVVAVTGDGVNDAPALRAADIGIAMGETGTDVARAAADMVLLDDNFASIVAAIEEGRAVFANIRKFLTYILTSNVPELVPYLAFVLFRVPLALTVIQILAVDLGTDMVPALALGAERPEAGTMQQGPRTRGGGLLDWGLLLRSYLFLGLLEAVGAMAAFFFVLCGGGWEYGQRLADGDPLYLRATTACLSAIVVMQVANVFLCRSERASAFSFGLLSNRLIVLGLITELALILLIGYTPPGNRLFGTAPIPASVWLFAVPFAAGMVALEEGRKWLVRRRVTVRPE